jgi:hypothetical protein
MKSSLHAKNLLGLQDTENSPVSRDNNLDETEKNKQQSQTVYQNANASNQVPETRRTLKLSYRYLLSAMENGLLKVIRQARKEAQR